MDERLVFINVGWMIDYDGSANDPTIGGHGYLREHSVGHESWNFLPVDGMLYGYVPRSARIQLHRLGASRQAQSTTGVTVVWIARSPRNQRTYVVGWYRGATVHRDSRHYRIRRPSQGIIEYQIEAPAERAKLLPLDQRVFIVPTAKVAGNLGQSPVWYGNDDFCERVRGYLAADGVRPQSDRPKAHSTPRQVDPDIRKLVELAAVRHAIAHYRSDTGGARTVESVERDNVGWDLNVTGGGETLKVEVKGLSGQDICVELTPNEYAQMVSGAHRRSYVIYVVTEALTDAAMSHVFYYNADASKRDGHVWSTSDGRVLKVVQMIGARLTA